MSTERIIVHRPILDKFATALRSASDKTKSSANIIFIGSTAGKFGEANHGDYAAAKSALMVLCPATTIPSHLTFY